MVDLVSLLGSLVSSKGKILIPGINELVDKVTEDERKLYGPIDFDLENFRKDIGVKKLMYDTKELSLMHRWRFPSLSIHGTKPFCIP